MPGGVLNQQQRESDESLAARGAAGDQAALVALSGHLFEDIYDFLLRLLLSRSKAASAALPALLRLRRQLLSGGHKGSPRLLALAAAYRVATEEQGTPAAAVDSDSQGKEELSAFWQVDADRLASADEASRAEGEAPIIWEAAAGVDRSEYALLDLHLRRGLSPAQVGRVVGMGKLKAQATIPKLEAAAEDAFVSLLTLKLGRGQCPELETIAAGIEKAVLPPESRRLVTSHAAACPVCRETRRQLVSPLKVFAALQPVTPLPDVKDAVLRDLTAYAAAQAPPAPPASARGEHGAGRQGGPLSAETQRRGAAAMLHPIPSRPPIGASPPGQASRRQTARPGGGSLGGPAFPILIGAAAALAVPVAAVAVWLAVLSGDGGGGSSGADLTATALAEVALGGCGEQTCTPTPTLTRTATSTPSAASFPVLPRWPL
jgi:hypothetical protein